MDQPKKSADNVEGAPVEQNSSLLSILQQCLRNSEVKQTLEELTNMVGKYLNSSIGRSEINPELLEKLKAEPGTVVALLYRLSQSRESSGKKEVKNEEMVPIQSYEGDEESSDSIPDTSSKITKIKREEFVADTILEEAFWKMKSCEPDTQKGIRLTGKFLFDNIFTHAEKAECFASGRGGKRTFPFQKVQNLSRALCWLQKDPPLRTLKELNKVKEELLEPTQFYSFREDILINYANVTRSQLKKQVASREEKVEQELPLKKRYRK